MQKIKVKTVKEQRLDAGLDLIIAEMGNAMWNANKEYVARSTAIVTLTPNMRLALDKFKQYCEEHYGKKS